MSGLVFEKGQDQLWVCRWHSPKTAYEENISFPTWKLQIPPNDGKPKVGNPNALRVLDHDPDVGLPLGSEALLTTRRLNEVSFKGPSQPRRLYDSVILWCGDPTHGDM